MRESIGTLILFAVIFIVFYDIIFFAFNTLATMYTSMYNELSKEVKGDRQLPDYLQPFTMLETLFNWTVFIFTNTIGFATIIALTIIYKAGEGEWGF